MTDGRLGVPTDARAEFFEECREDGFPVDLAAYQSGRVEGLEAFCTVENAFEVGLQGRDLPEVCPPTVAQSVRQAWARGREEAPRDLTRGRRGIGNSGVRVGVGLGVGSRGSTRVGVGVGVPVFFDDGDYGSRFDRRHYGGSRFGQYPRSFFGSSGSFKTGVGIGLSGQDQAK